MSDLALYRRYRPSKWSEVVGQEHIVSVLEGAISQGNIAHAYLFCGSRGTGKTSVARIFAQAIGTTPNDILEIDAASNTGVDDVRELREAVRSLPFESKYKVYIIDEVHMLSKAAFNALLKTLEEPPHYVVFILATTELSKLPETIVSRCQTYTFKKPSVETLKKVVEKTAKKEGVVIDDDSANLIAMLGDGSFRDTLGILQKAISASADKKIVAEEVANITGVPKEQYVFDFIIALLHQKADLALTVISKTVEENRDIRFFTKMIMSDLRLAMLLRFAPNLKTAIKEEVGEDKMCKLEELANHEKAGYLPAILKELLNIYDDIGRAYAPHLPLELVTIKIAQLATGTK
jgi:DNA polymerase-3 subunit gamma/tau